MCSLSFVFDIVDLKSKSILHNLPNKNARELPEKYFPFLYTVSQLIPVLDLQIKDGELSC